MPAKSVTPAAAPPPVTATLRDTLTGDVNGNGQADPGDTLTYTATIAANGTDANGVAYSAPLDPNTALVPGSLRATPVAVNDTYVTPVDAPLTVSAADGLLVNDFLGIPAAAGITAFQNPTLHGTVTVAPDGSFTYTPATGFAGQDTFTYTITNAAGNNTATVTIDVAVAAVAVDDTYNATKDTPLTIAAPGLLANDTGAPAPIVQAGIGPRPTAQGGTATVNADGSFTYTPPAGFVSPPNDSFAYTIGNLAGTSSATAHFVVDAAPSVSAHVPIAGATNVATGANISITFDEPVTVTANAFTLACPTPIVVTNITGPGPATTFVLDPATLLPAAALCTVTTVGAEVSDVDANDPPDHLLANDTFTFSTDAAPSVLTTVPANAAVDVAVNGNLSIAFTEAVNVTGNWFQIVCTSSGARNVSDTNVTTSDNITFTIDPNTDFSAADSCTATVFAAQISDQDANDPPDAPTANYVFSFTMDAAPSVPTTVPANGAVSITTNTNLTITFSEPVNVTGNWFQIVCGTSGTRNVADTAVTGGPTTFTINPTIDFTPGELCTTTVFAAQVADQDTNDPPDAMTANDVFSFTLEAAPSVQTTAPVNGATTASTTQDLTVTFSEPVNVTASSFGISCASSGPHTATVSGGPTTWTVNPDSDFTAGELCTVTVFAAQVSDQDAIDPPDAMTANYLFSFTVDTAPSVTATTPTNGAANQTTNADLTVTFGEPVNVAGNWFQIACATSGTRNVADTVVSGGPTTFTINPNSDFTAGETCTTTIFAAQVSDQDAGDPPDAPLADYVFSFTIDAAPSVTTTVPDNAAAGVALNANLTVTFSEPVNVAPNWFQIVCTISGLRQVADTVVTTSDNITFTINPNTNFAAGETCTPEVFFNRVTDQDGNDPPDQMLSNKTWTFSTDAAPVVALTTPANGTVGVVLNANIDLTFTEPVNAVSGSFNVVCTSSGAHTFVLTGGTLTYTLNPDTDFTQGETCTVTALAAMVTDIDANDPPDNMLANYVFSFTLEAAPFVQSSVPADTGVQGTSQNFSIAFSEPVNVTGNWFAIACPSRTQNVADTTVTTSDNITFTIDPNDDFLIGEGPCTVTVFAAQVTDQDANDPPDAMVANAVINFTIDVAPTVQATDPANGSSNAGPTQNISITFTEPVNVSGSWFTISCTTSGSHTATVSGGPTTFTLDPDVDFIAPETCTVTIVAAQVTDQDTGDPPDLMTADYVFSFQTDAAPSVLTTSPPNAAVDQAGNTNVIVTFTEPVNVTGTWFQIACPTSGTRTPANSVVTGGSTTYTINPNVDFASAEVCTATVFAAQVTDVDANDPPDNMAANYVFSFTIDAAPQVTTTVPANGATNLAANTPITINFTESVNVAAGGVTLGCPGAVGFTPALPQGPVTALVLTPSTDLTNGATCTVTVVAANVHDVDANDPPDLLDGNGDGTPGDNYVFSFTVDAAPRVTLPTSPANGATNQATNINITINFSEPVDLAAGAVTLGCPTAVPFGTTPALPATGATSIVIDPTSDLPTGSTCTVTVVAANATDSDTADPPDQLDGNGDGTAGDNHVFSFTTDAAPRVNIPTTPPNGATNVPPSSNITIAFSELANVAAGGITVECPVGTSIPFAPALPQNGVSAIVIDPTASLPGNTTCTVTVVATNVTDVDAADPPDQLDGNGDGVPGDNHVFTFQVAPEAVDDSYSVSPHLTLTVDGTTLNSVKANDNPPSATITGFGNSVGTANGTVPDGINTITTTLGTGGVVKLNADGTFTYIPPPDIANATDHFFYTVTGGDTADVSLVIQNQTPLIWFVDASYSGANGTSNGTQARPFTLLTGAGSFDASTLPDNNTNDVVFIKQGSYTCGLTLVTGQRIIGDGSSSDLATITPLTPVTGSSLPAFTGTKPTLTNGSGSCITLAAPSGNNTIRGVTIDPNAAAATGVSGTGFGTLTMVETVIGTSPTTGRALNLTTGTLSNGNVTLDSLRSTGSTTNGITLTGISGSMTVNNTGGATTISGATGAAISITGGSVSMGYDGPVAQANNAPLLSVSGGHAGTLGFQNGTLNASNGTGLQFDDADGTYNFNGTTTLSGGDAGVDILNGSSGSFVFATTTSITSPAGIAFNVDGLATTSAAAVTFIGNITQANNFALVSVRNHSTGTMSFQVGALTASNGTGLQFDNADGTYNFSTNSGSTSLAGGDAGIDIINGSGGSFTFGPAASPSNFVITNPTGTAFNVDGTTVAVTGGVTYRGNITQATNAAMVSVTTHSTGTITFQVGTLLATNGTGLQFTNADGTYNFNGTTTLNGGDAAIDVLNGSGGTFAFGGTTITSPSGVALNVDGSTTAVTGAISISGAISKVSAGRLIDFNNYDTATATISGTLTCNTACDGIEVTNDGTSSGTVNFSGSTKTFNTGTDTAINLDNNDGGTINFTGGNLDIDTTSGTGFSATNGGTVTVQGSNNSIVSTSATALNIANTTIGANNLTFHDISSGNNTAAADPADGIVLNNTGSSGHLTVTGDGNTAIGGNHSGGVIQHATNYGISLTSTDSPSFTNVSIHDIARNGIDGTGVVNFTFDNGQVTNTGTSLAGQYEENSIAFVDAALTANTVSGNVTITDSLISGGHRNAIMIETWNGTISNVNISNNVLSGPSDASALKDATLATTADILDAIHVFSQGSATLTGHITTGAINNNTISGFEFLSGGIFIGGNGIRVAGGSGNGGNATTSTLGAAATPIEITGNDVDLVGSNSIAVSFNGVNGLSNFNIHNNGTIADPMSNAEGLGISVFFGGSGTFSALVNDNVVDNNGPTVNAGSSGIAVQLDDGPAGLANSTGVATIHVNNNTVTNPDGFGIRGIVRASNGTLNLYIQNNDVGTPSAANRNAIRVDSGSAAGDTTLNLNMTGNSGPLASTTDNMVGSGLNAGIGLRKQGIVASVNEFNIQGIAANPTNAQVQAYVGSPVPPGHNYSADGSGGSANGVDIISGSAYGTTNAVPLLAAPGGIDSSWSANDRSETPAPTVDNGGLTQEELDRVLPAVRTRWRAAGLNEHLAAELHGVEFYVENLAGRSIAGTSAGHIAVGRHAGGHGWFVDPTPDQDEEFGPPSPKTGERMAKADGPAAGRMDLLTALMHEMGHARGEIDLDPIAHAGELMAATLPVGVRRGPPPGALIDSSANARPSAFALRASADKEAHHALDGDTVTVNIGTLPAGKSVVITYEATIAAGPLTGPGFSLSHQGTVSGANFAAIVTDDPDTAAPDDPTLTALVCPTMTVSPATIPNAIISTAYVPVIFTATGGADPTTIALTGALPSGMNFDEATATLSGTPTALGNFPITVTATDSNGCAGSRTYAFAVVPPTTTSATPSVVNFGAVVDGASLSPVTPAQIVTFAQTSGPAIPWTVSVNQPWLSVSPTSGSGAGLVSVSVVSPPAPDNLPATGALSGTITFNTTGASNSPTVTVNLTLLTAAQLTGPIGSVDSPANGATNVTGSIGVTGWAIDDIGATTVEIWRAPIAGEGAEAFIGFGTFVRGARPDIAALFPTKPYFDRAGWGYLLLTNMLPNQGNGTFTLRVYAKDVENNRVLLGQKTITCTNATATAPFGAIDTPEQGGIASGTLINFGWVLAAQPTASGLFIPIDGSTIHVFIDGVDRGAVDSYNNPRPDIQALFPGYFNTNGAVGVKFIDTMTAAFFNGLHTIAWLATDNMGNAAGIGSRFFTIANGAVVANTIAQPALGTGEPDAIDASTPVAASTTDIATIRYSETAIAVRHGFDDHAEAQIVTPDIAGVHGVQVTPTDRVAIDLAPAHDAAATYRGYVIDGDRLRALPVGSTLGAQTGEFVWTPGVGFGGTHALVFIREANGTTQQIRVNVTIANP